MKNKDLPFSISHTEWKNNKELKKTCKCPKCGKMHKIKQSESQMLQYISCKDTTFLVGLLGKSIK
jgi:ssDNA-binding Zn-finger/Zn-ribbon topoisomerase 1